DAVGAARLQGVHRASDICGRVGMRHLYRIATPRLRTQVDHALELLTREELRHRLLLGEVYLREAKARKALELREPRFLQRDVVVLVEVVEPDNLVPSRQELARRVKADEAGRAGDKDFHSRPSTSLAGKMCLMS